MLFLLHVFVYSDIIVETVEKALGVGVYIEKTCFIRTFTLILVV